MAAALLGAQLFLQDAGAAPRLTEFLAENQEGPKDEDGESSDYLEIHNPDAEPYNLSGCRLTDRASETGRWVFPTVVLQPGARLLVWASGKNRTNPKTPLHTNFRLEKSGGYLALFPATGEVPLTEYVTYPPQFTDRSYGLYQPETVRTIVAAGAPARWTIPQGPLPGWQNPDFNAAAWTAANTGIGFDLATSGTTYTPLFGAGGDTRTAMYQRNATAYLRVPFTLTNRTALSGLTLRVKYDDGFIAYLNGARVASRFAPDSPAWNSSATGLHDDAEALVFEDIAIPDGLGSLRDGLNVLSIHALNGDPANVDFLLVPELGLASLDATQPLRMGYMLSPTPGTTNGRTEDGFTEDTKFSVDRGLFSDPFTLTISCGTPGATIYYTLDSSIPQPRTARIYTGPITISRTTVVRAMADADARHPSNTDTQTYLFPADLIRQTAPSDYPATWGSEDNGFGTLVPVPADYAMDQGVVDAPEYAGLTERGLRESLPTISINGDKGLFFDPDGIYADGRQDSGEVPISMELLGPGWPADFQIDAGVRIHGGNARQHPKKPFRLYFRQRYGTTDLSYPLFPDSPVQRFDQLILRPGGHDGWAVPFGNQDTLLAFHATYVRDQFLRLTETQMGRLSPRGRYVNLYLNGMYWGLYDLHERANADFYSSHLGGEAEDWDVQHHPTFVGESYSQVDGNGEAWEEVLRLADAGVKSDREYQAMAALVDIQDYIDYLIVRIWAGDYDWCGPMYLKNGPQEAEAGYFDNKNWYSARRSRGAPPGGFLFHVWDAEMSMGTHLMVNRGAAGTPPWLPYFPPQRIAGFDSTRVGTPGSPAWPYAALRAYPPFRQRFGDRLQQHFFGKGRMTTAQNTARLDSLTSQLELPLVAESARWGDVNRFAPFNIALTRDTHWKPEIQWLRDTFIAGRNALVLNQFNAAGLFPSIAAPTAVPDGGTVPAGTRLTFQPPAPAGSTILYTLDGSDPSRFSPVSRRVLLDAGADCLWWVPTGSIGTTWRDFTGPSNPAVWRAGKNGLGYDQDPNYLPHFTTDVNTAMRGIRASIYSRIEFNLANQAEIDSLTGLTLEAKYEDGFIAAINGTVVQRANAPAIESSTSAATTVRDETLAVQFAPFNLNLSVIRPLLRPGRNVLALQGLNQSAGSSDFLLTVRLSAETGGTLSIAREALVYDPLNPPVLPGNVTLKARTFSGSVWSALTGTAYLSGVRASRENLVPSQIHYHPLDPNEDEKAAGYPEGGAFEFLELLNRSNQTVDLSGCLFTNGLEFDFANALIREIPPGGRILLARNPAALTFRYGPGLPIAGPFANNSALSNGGERLRLQAADGSPIFDLTYRDSAPWPGAADGSGPALVLVNPRGLNDPANPLHWRASLTPQATPGQADEPGFAAWIGTAPSGSAGPLDDPDRDGWPNLLEYATGTDPFDAAAMPFFAIEPSPDGPLLAFPISSAASAAALLIEESPSPAGSWTTARALTEIPSPAGPAFRQYETRAASPAVRRFYRLRATLP